MPPRLTLAVDGSRPWRWSLRLRSHWSGTREVARPVPNQCRVRALQPVPGHDLPMQLDAGAPHYIGKREAGITSWLADDMDTTTLFKLTV